MNRQDYFAGRKRRKSMDKAAKAAASDLLSVSEGVESPELDDAREMMSTIFALKDKNLDALLVVKKAMGGYDVAITFKELPRGVPNMIGAPGKARTEDQAEFEAKRLLTAAHVKIRDTRAKMRAGEMDDVRLFRYGDLELQVPGEMVDATARKLPGEMSDADRRKTRKAGLDRLRRAFGATTPSPESWSRMTESAQIETMRAAAELLCVEINRAG